MAATRIIDISRKIDPDTAVWPGDTPFQMETMMSTRIGEMVNLTTLTLSAHTATHADAPYHILEDDKTIDQVSLNLYWGPAQVVTVENLEGPILPDDLSGYDLSLAPRLLVRTPSGEVPYDQFSEIYPYPDPVLAGFLASKGILLYGTDALSMDAFDNQALPGHRAMIANSIAILEGLDLRAAKDGLYELCALPLRISGGDGSPVRAALRPL